MTFLSSYQHFNTSWASTSQAQRTLSNLIARLTMEELRFNSSETYENGAFWTNSKQKQTIKEQHEMRKETGKSYKCGKQSHWKRDCRVNSTIEKSMEKAKASRWCIRWRIHHNKSSCVTGYPRKMVPWLRRKSTHVRSWFVSYRELSKPIASDWKMRNRRSLIQRVQMGAKLPVRTQIEIQFIFFDLSIR